MIVAFAAAAVAAAVVPLLYVVAAFAAAAAAAAVVVSLLYVVAFAAAAAAAAVVVSLLYVVAFAAGGWRYLWGRALYVIFLYPYVLISRVSSSCHSS